MGTPKPTALQGVAQLGERLVWDQEAAGSTPVTLTIGFYFIFYFVRWINKTKIYQRDLQELV